ARSRHSRNDATNFRWEAGVMLSAFTRASNGAGRLSGVQFLDISTPSRSAGLARPESRRLALLSPAGGPRWSTCLCRCPSADSPSVMIPRIRPCRRAGYGVPSARLQRLGLTFSVGTVLEDALDFGAEDYAPTRGNLDAFELPGRDHAIERALGNAQCF